MSCVFVLTCGGCAWVTAECAMLYHVATERCGAMTNALVAIPTARNTSSQLEPLSKFSSKKASRKGVPNGAVPLSIRN